MVSNNFKINFNFYSLIVLWTLILSGFIVWADSNGVWHEAKDVRPGTIFGSDEAHYADGTTYYTFNNLFRSMKYSQFDSDVQIKGKLEVNKIETSPGSNLEIKLN